MVTDRIEQALRVWELTCFSSKLAIKRINMFRHGEAAEMFRGPVLHLESFRADVLKGKPFDAEKYIPQDEVTIQASGVFSFFPASVHAWATASRRIYNLEEDIQQLILQTDVSELTWKDIVFPFNAFGIALARPIQETGGQWFDFLLVHRGYIHTLGRSGIAIWTISQEYERPLGVTMKQFTRAYEDMAVRGKIKKSQELTEFTLSEEAKDKTAFGAKLNCFIADSEFFDRPLKDTFKYVRENEGKVMADGFLELHAMPHMSMAIEVERLVAGLCVYLDSHRNLSDTIKPRTNWRPVDNPTIDPNCVTNQAQVCLVQNVYDIPALERELIMIIDPVERKRRCDELGVHYREGYVRRRPGFGDDPLAPQCVHVRPTIVGLHRLAPNSLPRGTEKVFKE